MSRFAESLAQNDGSTTLVELVPWAGPLQDEAGERHRQTARDLIADERITALTVTDNAGGFVRLGPLTLGQAIQGMGGECVVHLACRDRSRAALQSTVYGLASEGLTNALALSGDYPKEGFGGRSRAVFDIDSVGLISMLNDAGSTGPSFTIGCAINPYKAVEADLVPQYLKLALKIRAGANVAITQVGYDTRSMSELLQWNREQRRPIPLMASVYILSKGVARVFHHDGVPGIRLNDDQLAWAEKQAAADDKGRAAFLEFAAKQVAVVRGMGYAGAYIAGQRNAGEIDKVLSMANEFQHDWQAVLKDIHYPEAEPYRMYEQGDLPLLASAVPAPPTRTKRVPLKYRFNRIVHDLAFEPQSRGFAVGKRVYGGLEKTRLMWPAHVLEQAVKIPMFDCQDCGDCSLPDIAYQCPEGACVKNQRNGPCGGSIDGQCEVPGKRCVWAVAYDRLRPYDEAMTMLDRAPVIGDNALRGTSAWANTFLGRDHYAREDQGGEA